MARRRRLLQSSTQSAVVHVLHAGRVLCGFTRRPPGEWPSGHLWVAVRDAGEVATCGECQRIAGEIAAERAAREAF